MFGYRTPRPFLAMLLPVLLFLACSQDKNGPQPPVKVQGFPSKEEIQLEARTYKGPTSDEILRTVQAHVPEVKPLSADVDAEHVLPGYYCDTTHVLGSDLSGKEFYLFPDRTYLYIRWADVRPETIYDKGRWECRDGFLVLLPDGSTPEDRRPRDLKYMPLILLTDRPNHATETRWAEKRQLLLLLGTDLSFSLFSGRRHPDIDETDTEDLRRGLEEDPDFQLRMCTYSKVESITSEEAEKLKDELFKECWRPDFLE
jgi:hypothetical protein